MMSEGRRRNGGILTTHHHPFHFNVIQCTRTDATNSGITAFSYLSMFVLLSSALCQLYYLRKFFNTKKML